MSQSKRLTEVSKYMSWALRHKPEEAGIVLDANGWTDVYLLVDAHNKRAQVGKEITTLEVLEVVRTCEKQRYAVSPDMRRIRANQGHSIAVDVELVEQTPPDVLYHGTAERFYEAIQRQGIDKMKRQHVHLSADVQTAMRVGARHGVLRLLKIDAQRMHADGVKFWISANGVWLVDHVDPKYLFKAVRENA